MSQGMVLSPSRHNLWLAFLPCVQLSFLLDTGDSSTERLNSLINRGHYTSVFGRMVLL